MPKSNVIISYRCDTLSFQNPIVGKSYFKKTIEISVVIYIDIYTYIDINIYILITSETLQRCWSQLGQGVFKGRKFLKKVNVIIKNLFFNCFAHIFQGYDQS